MMQAHNKPEIDAVGEVYDQLAQRQSKIGRLVAGNRDYINLRFSLYENIVADPDAYPSIWRTPSPDRKPWHRLYDEPPDVALRLMDPFAPELFEECVYCGGVDNPSSIDHFLEKAIFPEYSLFPLNLVPVCDACNPSRTSISGGVVHKIHPYLSDVLDRAFLVCRVQGGTAKGPKLKLELDDSRLSPEESEGCRRHMHYLRINERFMRYSGRKWRRLRNVVVGYSQTAARRYVTEEVRSVSHLHVNYWQSVLCRAINISDVALDILRAV